MSGAFPSTPLPAKVTLGAVWATLQDMTQSGRRNVRQLGSQKWTLSCAFPSTMSKAQFMPIMGFLMAQGGRFETFTFISPELKTPQGAASGTPLVNGGSQTGTSIITNGWVVSTLQMKAGDILKFAGSTKVYMVTQDASSDGSGNMTINIQPPLLESPANNEALTVTDVPFTMQLRDDNIQYTVSGPLLFQQNIEMIEAI